MAQLAVEVVFLSVFGLCFAYSPFDNILSNNDICEDKCNTLYGQHDEVKAEVAVCSRGCRFYSIADFVIGGDTSAKNVVNNADITPVRKLCYDSCIEAYNETSHSTVICKAGCDLQEIKTKDKEGEEQTMHVLWPIMQVREVVSEVLGGFHILQSSLHTYFMQDNKTVIAVASEPEVIVEVLQDADRQVKQDEPLYDSLQEEQAKPVDNGPSVVTCVSKQLGVPPYLLVISMLAIVIFIVYIIIAICTTPPSKTKSSGLSIQADAVTPVKFVHPEDLTSLSLVEDEDSEAGPLPVKVPLPNTHI